MDTIFDIIEFIDSMKREFVREEYRRKLEEKKRQESMIKRESEPRVKVRKLSENEAKRLWEKLYTQGVESKTYNKKEEPVEEEDEDEYDIEEYDSISDFINAMLEDISEDKGNKEKKEPNDIYFPFIPITKNHKNKDTESAETIKTSKDTSKNTVHKCNCQDRDNRVTEKLDTLLEGVEKVYSSITELTQLLKETLSVVKEPKTTKNKPAGKKE